MQVVHSSTEENSFVHPFGGPVIWRKENTCWRTEHISNHMLLPPFLLNKENRSIFFFFLEGNTRAYSRSVHGVHHIVASLDTGVGVKGLLEQSYKCFQFLEGSVYVETMDD